MSAYIGRFAPSPTGHLHSGSMVAALASWLDAQANQGQWIIRIEDLDKERCIRGVDQLILKQLSDCYLTSPYPVQWQSQRLNGYERAFNALQIHNDIYPCRCTRAQILSRLQERHNQSERNQEKIYPGTCRSLPIDESVNKDTPGVAWRFKSRAGQITWIDRRLGVQHQNVVAQVGDFILKRADLVWAYQLSVVVDDANSKVTHIVRGADLVDNTARQIQLQQALGHPLPQYLHTKLMLGENGEKLSKQNGATPANTEHPLECLNQAAKLLGLHAQSSSVQDALQFWIREWSDLYCQN